MKSKLQINRIIFWPGIIILLFMIGYGYAFNSSFVKVMTAMYNAVTQTTGWFMMLITGLIVILCFVVCATPVGNKKVGGENAEIKHGMFTWVAMVTCAGTATAVVFYAVGEPIGYFHNPPTWWNMQPETAETAVRAVSQAAFHWSFIYYALFAFWGFICGYMIMNHHLPARPSSALYPIIKDKCFGPIGKVFDILSLLGLVGGMVTSLGLGVQQFASGLDYVFGIKPSNFVYIVTLVLVCLSFTLSSLRGVKKGMAIISDINAWIYLFVIAFLLVVGPTVFELNLLTQVTGELFTRFIPNITAADCFNIGNNWPENNTVFYVAWVMAYAPLMGVFQGKVAVGYTWRRFLLVNVLGPGIFNIVWFVAFGGNAIFIDAFKNGNIGAEVAANGVPIANYALLKCLPLSAIMIPMVVAALFFGFVTLADAMTGTLAKMSIVSREEEAEEEAPMIMKVVWGAVIGLDTFLCLFCLGTGGTTALQFMSVVFGLPIFVATLCVICGLGKTCSGRLDAEIAALTVEQREDLTSGRQFSKVAAPVAEMTEE